MSQPDHERRTVQNTNDILSIYDMLSEMDGKLAKQTVQLSNIASKVEAHDARFDATTRGSTRTTRSTTRPPVPGDPSPSCPTDTSTGAEVSRP